MKTNATVQIVKNLGEVISKNSPSILSGLAVGGLFTTAIFAVRATPKALNIIDNLYSEPNRVGDPTKIEILKHTWKLYIPAASMGIVTVACIIGSNSINQRRNAALATVYGLTEAAFREYKEKIVETIGKNKELKVRDDISKDRIIRNSIGDNEVIFTGKGEVLCYDTLSGRYFKSDIEHIRRSLNQINKEFLSDMWVSLNDLYYELGLSGVKLGEQMGWDLDQGLVEVTFSSQLSTDNEPCLVLNYDVIPKFYNK